MKKTTFILILVGILLIPITSLAYRGTYPMHGYFFGDDTNTINEPYNQNYNNYMDEYHNAYIEDKEAWIDSQLEQGLISQETADVMKAEIRFMDEYHNNTDGFFDGSRGMYQYGGPCH